MRLIRVAYKASRLGCYIARQLGVILWPDGGRMQRGQPAVISSDWPASHAAAFEVAVCAAPYSGWLARSRHATAKVMACQ